MTLTQERRAQTPRAAALSPSGATSRRPIGASGFRSDVQALRALAVALVLTYHLWPRLVPGGYVGVDVFFVISGFLITQHLLRDVAAHGRVRFGAFWAKRIRRLLPASLLVLVATTLGVPLLLHPVEWQDVFTQVRAAAFYFENWQLAASSVDYLQGGSMSPVEHYWSLSTEEQFYLIWPIVIALVASRLAQRRLPRASNGSRALMAIGGVTVCSFLLSIVAVHHQSSGTYFWTPIRAWEFGAGGLLALVPARSLQRLTGLRAGLSWAGIGCILIAAMLFGAGTPFPGYAALLPVVGALAVIAAGASSARFGPERLMRIRVVQQLGDLSYPIYLWHMPVFALLSASAGSSLAARLGTIAITIPLAIATDRFVERPLRYGRLSRRANRWTFAAAAVAMVVVAGLATGGIAYFENHAARSARAASAAVTSDVACLGASALVSGCAATAAAPIPDEFALTGDVDSAFTCFAQFDEPMKSCEYPVPHSTARIAVVGDSHAAMLLPGLRAEARKRHWTVTTFVNAGCVWGDFAGSPRCHNRDSMDSALRDGRFDLVVMTASRAAFGDSSDTLRPVGVDPRVPELQRAFRTLTSSGTPVLAIEDNPRTTKDALECSLGSAPRSCGTRAAEALSANDFVAAAAKSTPGVTFVPTSRLFCRSGWCPSIEGGVRVYWDVQHITGTFSRTLGPVIGGEIQKTLDGR